eukprot:354809-Pelagomonas_calceolata.AAC.6
MYECVSFIAFIALKSWAQCMGCSMRLSGGVPEITSYKSIGRQLDQGPPGQAPECRSNKYCASAHAHPHAHTEAFPPFPPYRSIFTPPPHTKSRHRFFSTLPHPPHTEPAQTCPQEGGTTTWTLWRNMMQEVYAWCWSVDQPVVGNPGGPEFGRLASNMASKHDRKQNKKSLSTQKAFSRGKSFSIH